MGIQTIGQVTPQELLVFTATIHAGLDQALNDNAGDIHYPNICFVKNAVETYNGGDGTVQWAQRIPDELIFNFSPPTGQMEELEGNNKTFHPLVRGAIRVKVKQYHLGYKISKKDFLNDVYGTLAAVPRKLARGARKLGDILVARLLRNGKVTKDYTKTNFFATGKPLSPSGARSGNFNNLFTGAGAALTSINLGRIIAEMMSLTNEDGLSLNVMPDTLIVPPTLYPEAVIAVKMITNVFSDGNPAPGQVAGTAAHGANWVAMEGMIKRVVKMNELLIGGAAIDRRTWYVAETMNPDRGGAWGILYAETPNVDFMQSMALNDYSVAFLNEFTWGVERWAGVAPGLPHLIARCEQP